MANSIKQKGKRTYRNKWRPGIVIVLLIIVLVCINGRQNSHVHVTGYMISSEKTEDSMRIAQVSDFHNDKKLGSDLLDRLKEAAPDIIVVTGDFIDRRRTDTGYALTVAKEMVGIAPVYYVPGNHEAKIESYEDFRQKLAGTGVRVLENESESIAGNIVLTGIYDPWFDWDPDADLTGNVAHTLSQLDRNEDRFNILLSHRPGAFQAYAGYDLVFTGHVHGGQFRIPVIGGLLDPEGGLFPEYDAGEYREGGTTMIVSRGIGNSIIPLRVNDPPELVIVDINTGEKDR